MGRWHAGGCWRPAMEGGSVTGLTPEYKAPKWLLRQVCPSASTIGDWRQATLDGVKGSAALVAQRGWALC
eukprot:1006272-Pleurochrysis_carterae.AAC.1